MNNQNMLLLNKEEQFACKECSLFTDLDEQKLSYALTYFDAQRIEEKKGEMFDGLSGEMMHFFLILRGIVNICHDTEDGGRVIMASVTAGKTFGESLCFLRQSASVFPMAVTDATLLQLSTDRLRLPPCNEMDFLLSQRFTSMLALRTLSMNDRIQLLSKLKIRDKVLSLLSQYAWGGEKTCCFPVERNNGHCNQKMMGNEWISLPMDRAAMAFYLGVDRAALSRELGQLRRQGVLDFHKNDFRIL